MEGAVNEIIVVRAAKGELPRESGLPSVWAARSSSPFGLFVGLTETGKVSAGLRRPARGQYKEADKTDTKTASHGRGKAPALSCLVLSINLVHCGNEFRNSALHIMESGNWCSP